MMKSGMVVFLATFGLGGAWSANLAAAPQLAPPWAAVSDPFSHQTLDPTHVRVTVDGARLTSREEVESYLLYRTAELTAVQGFDWFEIVDQPAGSDKGSQTVAEPQGEYGYWRPDWRYQSASGWRDWNPLSGQPFWGDSAANQGVSKFQATAEIIVGHGATPANNERAFAAQEVISDIKGD